jgi:hypothetical protein
MSQMASIGCKFDPAFLTASIHLPTVVVYMDIHTEANSPAQAAQLPQKSLAFTDPYLYLVQPQFNCRIRCRRTNKRITFADVGDPEGPPVLFFLPSACSRYLAVMCDGLAREVGVRMVAMDRPGSGGTEQCPLNERVKIVGGEYQGPLSCK